MRTDQIANQIGAFGGITIAFNGRAIGNCMLLGVVVFLRCLLRWLIASLNAVRRACNDRQGTATLNCLKYERLIL
jgi:hypothetical protein